MRHLRLFASLVSLLSLALVSGRGGFAQINDPPVARQSGEVSGFSQQTFILTLETRLGTRQYQLTESTLVTLNGRQVDTDGITEGDHAVVVYELGTANAVEVRLTREEEVRGRVIGVSNTTLEFRTKSKAILTLRPDDFSHVDIAGLPVDDLNILLRRTAKVIYEPGTFLLLSLAADANYAAGTISVIDAATRTLTVTGKKERAFVVDANATIRRDGETAAIDALAVGDKVRVAFVKGTTGLVALSLSATAPPATTARPLAPAAKTRPNQQVPKASKRKTR
jgi:hypothetical protein